MAKAEKIRVEVDDIFVRRYLEVRKRVKEDTSLLDKLKVIVRKYASEFYPNQQFTYQLNEKGYVKVSPGEDKDKLVPENLNEESRKALKWLLGKGYTRVIDQQVNIPLLREILKNEGKTDQEIDNILVEKGLAKVIVKKAGAARVTSSED